MTEQSLAAHGVGPSPQTTWREMLKPIPGTGDLNLSLYTEQSLLAAAPKLWNEPTHEVLDFLHLMSAGQRKSESREAILGVLGRALNVDVNTLDRWRVQCLERESGDLTCGLLQAVRQGVDGVRFGMSHAFIMQDRVYTVDLGAEDELRSIAISDGCQALDDFIDESVADLVLTSDQHHFVREIVKLAIVKTHADIRAHEYALNLIENDDE